MENNRLVIVLLFFASLLGAQEYYLKEDEGESRIYQRLAWQADQNALRYEVVIEQLTEETEEQSEEETGEQSGEETFIEMQRVFTGESFIEVSLSPGKYRYRVTAFDFLNRPGIASDWAVLEILIARIPELLDFSPRVFYVDVDSPRVITVLGRNISGDTEMYLQQQGKDRVIVPKEIVNNDSLSEEDAEDSAEQYQQVFLFFDRKRLVPGNYRLYLKNPGNFDASGGPFEIGFNPKFDMYIGLAYTPLIPSFAGAAVRFGMVPIKKTFGFFGLELSANWHYITSNSGGYSASYQTIGPELNVLYQIWLSNRIMAITIRAGGGLGVTMNYRNADPELNTRIDSLLPLAKAGPGFLWLINRRFFIEAELDFIYWFTGMSHAPGFIRPWLGGGVKL